MRVSLEESMERLGTDRFPLVYLHDPERIPFEDATAPGGPVEVLVQMKDEGLIGHLGVAGGPIGLLARFVDLGPFEAVITHNRFTLLDRSAEPLLDRCAAALQFSLRDPRITTTIVGITKPERLDQTLELAAVRIERVDLADRLVREVAQGGGGRCQVRPGGWPRRAPRGPSSAGPRHRHRGWGCPAPRTRGAPGRTPPCAAPRPRRARSPAAPPARG